MLFVGCTTDKELLEKSVLDIEYAKRQTKIKKHGFNVQGGP